MNKDVRIEILNNYEKALERKLYLEGRGFTVKEFEQAEYVTVDSREAGGREDLIEARNPWVVFATKNQAT